jgi:hypothetical protein
MSSTRAPVTSMKATSTPGLGLFGSMITCCPSSSPPVRRLLLEWWKSFDAARSRMKPQPSEGMLGAVERYLICLPQRVTEAGFLQGHSQRSSSGQSASVEVVPVGPPRRGSSADTAVTIQVTLYVSI